MGETDHRAALFDRLAVVGKAFASAKRLEIIDLLSQGERTVDALARAAGMGLSTVSAHLQILKLAEVVSTRREKTRIYYRLAGDDVAQLYASLGAVARERSADVSRALAAYLGTGALADVAQVTRDELVQRMREETVVVLDVRPAEEFRAGHIPGALSMPFGDLPDRAATLHPEPEIVAYCRGAHCVMAHDAVRLLTNEGRRARRLEDGILEWRLAGLPVTTGE